MVFLYAVVDVECALGAQMIEHGISRKLSTGIAINITVVVDYPSTDCGVNEAVIPGGLSIRFRTKGLGWLNLVTHLVRNLQADNLPWCPNKDLISRQLQMKSRFSDELTVHTG